MAKIAKRAGAARQRKKRSAARSQRSGKKKTGTKRKEPQTTARASMKIDAEPAEQLTVPQADDMTSEQIVAMSTAICNALDDAVELLACLPALKGVAQVVDECVCPPDPAKNPPDWCVLITRQVQRELEYAIRCVNHAIHRRLQQVAIIMGLNPIELPHTSSCD